MLVGRGVVMDLHLGLGKVPLELSWISSCCYFNILLGLPVRCLLGTLPLRYCSARFARRIPFWTLSVPGHVAGLVAAEFEVAHVDEVEVVGGGQWRHYLCYPWGVCRAAQKTACQIDEGIWKFHGFKLYMPPLVGRPSLHGYDACMFFV